MVEKGRIHVCYGMTDNYGTYSKLTGTSICSIFENTNEPVTVHIIHDITLTDRNREKFIELAESYGQEIKFYDVGHKWDYVWERIDKTLPGLLKTRFTIGMFFRLLIGKLLVGVNRVIYFDSDIIVNMDIASLWAENTSVNGLAAVADSNIQNVGTTVINNGMVESSAYFNSGVLLIDVDKFCNEPNFFNKLLEFFKIKPEYPDQDALNYYFPNSCTLPSVYNTWPCDEFKAGQPVKECIYHYVNNDIGMDMKNEFDALYFKYFTKTPWCDGVFIGNLADKINSTKLEMMYFANRCAGKRRLAIGYANAEKIFSSLCYSV